MADLAVGAFKLKTQPSLVWKQAGESGIAAMQPLYIAASGKVFRASADVDAANAAASLFSIGGSNAVDDWIPCLSSDCTLDPGVAVTQGTRYYVSNNPGGIAAIGDLTVGTSFLTTVFEGLSSSLVRLHIFASGVLKA